MTDWNQMNIEIEEQLPLFGKSHISFKIRAKNREQTLLLYEAIKIALQPEHIAIQKS